MPSKAEETIDYKTRSKYRANKTKDTEPRVVEDITYEPRLATFEMDVMASMSIQEHRKPKKSYWY
jgi:large subunit ribosomal protein L24